MPPSSVAARSLALALVGVAAAVFSAHGQNVTAFNPYSGVGLPGGPSPQNATQAPPAVTAPPMPPAQMAGPAFNPWTLSGAAPVAPQQAGAASVRPIEPGTSLPPPPSRIASHIVAVPELTTDRSRSRNIPKTSAAQPVPKSASLAVVAPKAAPAPASPASPKPPAAAKPTPAAASPKGPSAASLPAPAPPAPPSPPAPSQAATSAPVAAPPSTVPASEQKMAALAPQPSTAARVPLTVSLVFPARSAELSDSSRAELDRLIKGISERGLRQVELRSFAGNGEPDSRKVSLARALNVRTYLIDKGVKSKIEIGTFSSSDGNERVEIVVPNT
jgi:outer membrane protein OmpA-like peptidoglycan-associated protein